MTGPIRFLRSFKETYLAFKGKLKAFCRFDLKKKHFQNKQWIIEFSDISSIFGHLGSFKSIRGTRIVFLLIYTLIFFAVLCLKTTLNDKLEQQ